MRRDAEATLDRWEGRWSPSIACVRPGRILWRGRWTGPCGGQYTCYALTRRGIDRFVEREMARWTRRLRRVARTRHRRRFA